MYLDHCLVFARARDLALQRNLAAVDVDAVLLGECVGDVFSRDRAEELAAFTDAYGDLDADLFELRGQKTRFVGRLLQPSETSTMSPLLPTFLTSCCNITFIFIILLYMFLTDGDGALLD